MRKGDIHKTPTWVKDDCLQFQNWKCDGELGFCSACGWYKSYEREKLVKKEQEQHDKELEIWIN